MSSAKEEEQIERLVKLMCEEGARFDAESAWNEKSYPEHERERRQVKIMLAELRVMNR